MMYDLLRRSGVVAIINHKCFNSFVASKAARRAVRGALARRPAVRVPRMERRLLSSAMPPGLSASRAGVERAGLGTCSRWQPFRPHKLLRAAVLGHPQVGVARHRTVRQPSLRMEPS